jgi:hypothetical protein
MVSGQLVRIASFSLAGSFEGSCCCAFHSARFAAHEKFEEAAFLPSFRNLRRRHGMRLGHGDPELVESSVVSWRKLLQHFR